MEKNKFPSINRKLLPMKAHYFFNRLGISPVFSNLSTIARQKGLSSTIVGLLLTVLSLLATVSKPLFGMLADRYKIHKLIFVIMQLLAGLFFYFIYFIPPISSQITVKSYEYNTEISFCSDNPIWDNCLDARIEKHETKVLKCLLACKSESWMQESICQNPNQLECNSNFEAFTYDILLDMQTITKNSSCLIMNEFRNISNSNNSTMYFNTVPLYAKLYKTNCDVTCEDEFFKGTLANKGTLPDDEITKKYQFWLFCLFVSIGMSATSVVISMGDTICFDLLGEDSHNYGKQKIWDSLGAGLAAIFVGAIIDMMSGDSVFKDYTVAYYFSCLLIILGMLCSMKIQNSQSKKSESIVKDVGKLLKSWKMIVFCIWVSFVGFFSAVIWNFLFWHLEELSDKISQNECGGNYVKTLQGIDVVIQCILGEMPFFFWSGKIFKKIGHVNCMHLVFGAFAVRFFYYSMLSNPWWILPVELFNGITYGLMCAAMTSYANLISPPGAEATVMGLVGALFEGFGIAAGNVTAGTLINIVGASTTFMIFGCLAVCAMLLHILAHTLLNLYDKHNKRIPSEVRIDEYKSVKPTDE